MADQRQPSTKPQAGQEVLERTASNEHGPGGGPGLEMAMERLRRSQAGASRPPSEVRAALAPDDAPVWNPGEDSADVLPEPAEPSNLIRRTEDGVEVHGAADDDQRMR